MIGDESREMLRMGVMLAFTAALIFVALLVFLIARNFGNGALEAGYETKSAQEAAGLRSFSAYDGGKIPSASVYSVLVQEYAQVSRVETTFDGDTRYYATYNGVWCEWERNSAVSAAPNKTFEELYKPLYNPSDPMNTSKYVIGDPSHAMLRPGSGNLSGKVFVNASYDQMTGLYAVKVCDQATDYLTFAYTGAVQSVSLPPGVYKISCWGAQGGFRSSATYSGKGGFAEGVLTLTDTTKVFIYVGGSGVSGGFNGGGIRTGGTLALAGGGGASDVRIGTDSLFARVIVAGGGGSDGAVNKPGKDGGGLNGVSATESFGSGGQGGTQTAGGAGSASNAATAGSFGKGGNGLYYLSGYGGAGGGGWFGGGGAYPDTSLDDDRGGGGGSGYVLTASSFKPSGYLLGSEYYLSDTLLTIGGNEGDGVVRIVRLYD